MDRKLQTEMEDLFLNMIANMREYNRKKEVRIDKQLWQPIHGPLHLKDAIMMRTKRGIDEIRQAYGIQGVSHLKKEALSEELARTVPILFDQMLKNLDASIYEIVKGIVDSDGMILADGLSKATIRLCSRYCFAFPGMINNQKVLYLPAELMDAFKRIDLVSLENKIAQNTEWITLINGLLYHFGVMDTFTLNEKLNHYSSDKLSYVDFLSKINDWEEFYNSFKRRSEIVSKSGIDDVYALYNEIQTRTELEDYPFTREEVFEAGSNTFIESNEAIERFKVILGTYYGLDEEEMHPIVDRVVMMVKRGSPTMSILDSLKTVMDISSYKLTKIIGMTLMDMNNETRQWLLKGYKPEELYTPQVNRIKENTLKIGRNETCPCGSGKKYKKCCGK